MFEEQQQVSAVDGPSERPETASPRSRSTSCVAKVVKTNSTGNSQIPGRVEPASSQQTPASAVMIAVPRRNRQRSMECGTWGLHPPYNRVKR